MVHKKAEFKTNPEEGGPRFLDLGRKDIVFAQVFIEVSQKEIVYVRSVN